MEVSGNFHAPGSWQLGKKIRLPIAQWSWGREPCKNTGKKKNIFPTRELNYLKCASHFTDYYLPTLVRSNLKNLYFIKFVQIHSLKSHLNVIDTNPHHKTLELNRLSSAELLFRRNGVQFNVRMCFIKQFSWNKVLYDLKQLLLNVFFQVHRSFNWCSQLNVFR
jgi:hypothetical protein